MAVLCKCALSMVHTFWMNKNAVWVFLLSFCITTQQQFLHNKLFELGKGRSKAMDCKKIIDFVDFVLMLLSHEVSDPWRFPQSQNYMNMKTVTCATIGVGIPWTHQKQLTHILDFVFVKKTRLFSWIPKKLGSRPPLPLFPTPPG